MHYPIIVITDPNGKSVDEVMDSYYEYTDEEPVEDCDCDGGCEKCDGVNTFGFWTWYRIPGQWAGELKNTSGESVDQLKIKELDLDKMFAPVGVLAFDANVDEGESGWSPFIHELGGELDRVDVDLINRFKQLISDYDPECILTIVDCNI